jgi:hypothetical protein
MPVCEIKSATVKKNRDGDKNVLMLNVEISEPEDIQSAESMRIAGIDSNPPVGSKGFVNEAGEAWKIVVAINDNVQPDTNPGEIEIYSSASGNKLATLRFTADNKIVAQGGGDNAVRYSALESAFNQLKADFNSLVTAYNTHVHPGVTAGANSTATTLSTGGSSTADIGPSKIDDIEVP